MSYQVLARKWRPGTFAEVAGQQPILQALINSLQTGNLHHAYLFSGTRGIGKTTLARIIAKCLNCELGMTATPCGRCNSCLAVDAGKHLDVLEIDAASKTKVEDTRALLENVAYAPVKGAFRVYIIDEVHMLSNHSFNALLKTLEEPPAHVKFLLATTEPKKLPATILSRCLQFHLHNFDVQQINAHLIKILSAENIQYEAQAIQHISFLADGSMRDALTLLDQVIALSNGHITTLTMRQMLGIGSEELLIELLSSILHNQAEQSFKLIHELALQAVDFKKVLTEIQTLLHKLALLQVLPDYLTLNNSTELAIDTQHKLLALAKLIAPQEVQVLYQIALNGQRDLPFAPSLMLGFEMVVLRMLCFQPVIINNVEKSEHKVNKINLNPSQPIKPQEKPEIKPSKHDLHEWKLLVSKLNLSGMAKIIAEYCQPVVWEESFIELSLDPNYRHLLKPSHKAQIQEKLGLYTSKNINIEILIKKTMNRLATDPEIESSATNITTVNLKPNLDLQVKKMQQLLQAEVEDVTTVKVK